MFWAVNTCSTLSHLPKALGGVSPAPSSVA